MYLYCDNLELCPKCGKFPDKWGQVWRVTSLQCECGNNYGGVVKFANAEGTGEAYIKKVYQQWQDGVRNENRLPKLECEFISFKTQNEMIKHHNKKIS